MFVHLHNHTHYSLLDGLSRPKECVAIAKKYASPAIAITDHGVLYAAIEFYKEARKEDIKPIIGCELYTAPEGRLRKEPGVPINHLTVLAYNNEGYQNLIQLVTKAHLEGFYYKPRVDHGLLREFHKGLIVLSGCIVSELAQAMLNGNEEKALQIIKMYQEIFGKENFFLEIMDHPEVQEIVTLRQKYIEFSKQYKIPIVATNDNHYVKKDDADAHDILICIQTNRQVGDANRMRYTGDYSIRSPEEMKLAFRDCKAAVENTVEIANRCNIEIKFQKNLIPIFPLPEKKLQYEYLKELCEKGLIERYGKNSAKEIKERLNYELKIIHEAGFETYFLIVHDVIKYAKENNVIVGPGRGSVAGSLVSYCLKITDIDPLQYGLLFERFLNPERVTMPDIDIDFDDEHRNKVLEYVTKKYGRENVAQIITFGTMASRAAIRDTGRAMGYPYAEVDRIAKMIPPPIQGRHVPLAFAMNSDPELKRAYEAEPRVKTLLNNALKLEGTVRHAGTHACAVVISPEKLIKYTPLQYPTGESEEITITQYSMKPLDELGLLKMDFLGLRNLTILRLAIEIIEQRRGIKIDISKISLDDKRAFELLAAGETTGVFQMESSGMRHYLKDLKPTKIHDIIAMISLYRPGPMAWIPMYIRGKHESEQIKYLHKSFEPILKETYGVAVYQEQILEIAKIFAGFSLGEADILRKAVAKKDPHLLQEQKEKFIEGATKNNHSRKFAEAVFEKVIEPFAAYGFNKSHATCYGFIAYQTAYLKANYPIEFMAALMSTDADNMDRIVLEVNECEEMDIKILPPSINESFASFTVVDDKTIRFGLKAIKGIGDNAIAAILETREKEGLFKNIEDFARKVPITILNKKILEALALSGAMDCIGERKEIAANAEEISSYARQIQNIASQNQMGLFSGTDDESISSPIAPHLQKVAPATVLERLNFEKEFLGLYVSGHPLQGLKKYLAKKVHFIKDLSEKFIGKRVKLGGIITKMKKILTKTGSYMAYTELEDPTGRIEIILFPKIYQQCISSLLKGQIIFIEGRLEERGDHFQCIADSISDISFESLMENARKESEQPNEIYHIQIPRNADPQVFKKIKTILLESRGHCPVMISVPARNSVRKIKLPFGVNVSDELKNKIAAFL